MGSVLIKSNCVYDITIVSDKVSEYMVQPQFLGKDQYYECSDEHFSDSKKVKIYTSLDLRDHKTKLSTNDENRLFGGVEVTSKCGSKIKLCIVDELNDRKEVRFLDRGFTHFFKFCDIRNPFKLVTLQTE